MPLCIIIACKICYDLNINEGYIEVDSGENTPQKWMYISYGRYADVLVKFYNSNNNIEQGKKFILEDYASFVNTFCDYLTNKLPNPNEIVEQKWKEILSPQKDLVDIRMDDIWQKPIVNLIAIEFSKNKYQVNDVSTGFSRGTAIFGVTININDKCLFGIQVQNGAYRRLLKTEEKDDSKIQSLFKDKLTILNGLFEYDGYGWENNSCSIFEKENNTEIVYPQNKDKNSFCQAKILSINTRSSHLIVPLKWFYMLS